MDNGRTDARSSLTLRYRLGLKPILRRVWALRGEQPTARVHWRYQWLWLYGFVHPESGETYFWILPRVNITLFNQVLEEIGISSQRLPPLVHTMTT